MKCLGFLIFFLLSFSVLAQDEFEENKEGFDHLPKSTLRKEIAFFSTWGKSEKSNHWDRYHTVTGKCIRQPFRTQFVRR
jgi:hypothetical protein